MRLNYFKPLKILAATNGPHHYLLLGSNLIFVACFVIFLWNSAILVPATIAAEILAKFLLSHLMEKWMLRMKQKFFK